MSGRAPQGLLRPVGLWSALRLRRRLDRIVQGRRLLVVGARRAGNHAVVAWLANALAGEAVVLSYPDWRAGAAPGARVLHCNDVPKVPGSLRHRDLDRAVRSLVGVGSVGDLVVSYEDTAIATLGAPILLGHDVDARILVTRPLLDLVASRLARVRGATTPLDRTMFACTQAWLDVEVANRAGLPADWIEVAFDRWLVDPEHRRTVLDRLGLAVDVAPERLAPLGGGSSFAGAERLPDAAELNDRRHRIDWDPDTVGLLLDPRTRPLLRDDEVAFLEGRRSG